MKVVSFSLYDQVTLLWKTINTRRIQFRCIIPQSSNWKKLKMLFSFIFSILFPVNEAANFRTTKFLSYHNIRRRSTAPDLFVQNAELTKIKKNVEKASWIDKVCNIKTCFKCEKALMNNIQNGFCQTITSMNGCCDSFSQQAFWTVNQIYWFILYLLCP